MPYGFNDDKSKYTLDDLIALLNGDMNWFLKNSKYIYGTKANNDSRQMIGLNANNQLVIGYGGFQNSDVDTYLEGNNIELRSQGEIRFKSGTGAAINYAPTAWAYLVGSASATNYVRYCKRASVVFIEVNYSSGAGLTTTNKKLATLPTGFRPDKLVTIVPNTDANNLSKLWVNAAGEIYAKTINGTAAVCQGIVSYPIG